ncbi:ribosome silencing factor [Hippea sp. KM1]|uniref:ribosome silencing factor n=1 Tax=Hippea sp. KM1 TaxID=944481 RepID=UPI00046D3677|nr:ribosome silencing factor [Hippea sp. KM1]
MKDTIVEILKEKKVEDINVVDLRMKSALFDFFVIGTVQSNKQVYAILDEIKKKNIEIHHIEETSDGNWTLIDCYDVVVHLFTEDKRREYDLDSLWDATVKIKENG